jgi:C-terminal processing protease CtpA/Prc
MAKFGRIEIGNKFRFYSQIFGFSKEFEVKSKNAEKFTYINEHDHEKDVFKQDCGNVVIINSNIDQNELRDKIVRGATKALSEQLKKLNDPYYASMIAENIKNMEIKLKIEFVSDK